MLELTLGACIEDGAARALLVTGPPGIGNRACVTSSRAAWASASSRRRCCSAPAIRCGARACAACSAARSRAGAGSPREPRVRRATPRRSLAWSVAWVKAASSRCITSRSSWPNAATWQLPPRLTCWHSRRPSSRETGSCITRSRSARAARPASSGVTQSSRWRRRARRAVSSWPCACARFVRGWTSRSGARCSQRGTRRARRRSPTSPRAGSPSSARSACRSCRCGAGCAGLLPRTGPPARRAARGRLSARASAARRPR